MQTQIINFSIPKPLLLALDNQARSEVKTRSEALRDAIRLYINQQQNLNNIFTYGQSQAKKLKLKPEDVEAYIDQHRQGK